MIPAGTFKINPYESEHLSRCIFYKISGELFNGYQHKDKNKMFTEIRSLNYRPDHNTHVLNHHM